MKKLNIYIFALSFILFSFNAKSQEVTKIQKFLKKVEINLQKLDSSSMITICKQRANNRNIFTEGTILKEEKSFKQCIKYYRGGLKKEKIVIYSQSPFRKKLPIISLVKFNDKMHFIQYNEIAKNDKNEMVTVSSEILIDSKYYKNTTYDKYGKTIKIECDVNLNK